VVRLSGPRAGAIVAALVRPFPDAPESHRLYHGYAHDPSSGERLDEVLACVMRAPRSFTGEEVGELHGHGGAANLARLLEAARTAGARLAEPGEFTRRAFLAGRIDLSRAEAVALKIAARSERALRLAQAHADGALAERVADFRRRVVEVLAEVEARIDFPEEDLDFAPGGQLALTLSRLAGEVARLAATELRGRLALEGAEVVLAGRPNAGKSSLLNALLGEERALVDGAPGTTRDAVEGELSLGGLKVRLVDTAGERDGEAGVVERRGVELGRKRRARADLVVVVVDGSVGFGPLEDRLLAEATAAVVAWNKSDINKINGLPAGVRAAETVAPRGEGLTELRALIAAALGAASDGGELLIASARQRAALEEAEASLASSAASLACGAPPELLAVDLRTALDRLSRITGESVDPSVLDQVFARFCVGK
jgi:tRNA modification GTPase